VYQKGRTTSNHVSDVPSCNSRSELSFQPIHEPVQLTHDCSDRVGLTQVDTGAGEEDDSHYERGSPGNRSGVIRPWYGLVRQRSMLLRLPKPDVILVQNPPALPTLAAAWMAARLRGARLVIDWHNLSHTILAVRLGEEHRAVRALKRSERRWARRADAHLTVSKSLADWLQREWQVNATVLYDRPPAMFTKPSLDAANDLWQRLARDLNLGPRRIPIVVAPSSWTLDEDFDLLLEALERAERTLAARLGKSDGSTPDLAVLLTAAARCAPTSSAAPRDANSSASRCAPCGSTRSIIPP
jgi:hypothetical protein